MESIQGLYPTVINSDSIIIFCETPIHFHKNDKEENGNA